MKKIIDILLKILDCITLRGLVERSGATEEERHTAVQRALEMHRNGELSPLPAVYKLDNGNYNVYVNVDGFSGDSLCGIVVESDEPKNYPVGRYSLNWNPKWMSKVENYGREE